MKRREIFIDLTALLDVILIILFVILAQARTQTARALEAAEADRESAAGLTETASRLETELSQAREEEDRLREENEALRRELLTDELVVDNSLVITLSAGEDGTIRVEDRGEAPLLIPYDWADDTYAANRLRSTLSGLLRDTDRSSAFIVFQYDRSRIYRTEYDMVRAVLQEIKLEARQRELPLSLLELDTNTLQ